MPNFECSFVLLTIYIMWDCHGTVNHSGEHYKKHEDFIESNFVFGNLRPLPQNTARLRMIDYCKLAGVKKIRIHDFRHSHASYLISKGYDIVTIARRLGHSDIEMTLNRYAHMMPQAV